MPGSPSAASLAARRILIPALLGVAALGANARTSDVYDAAVAHAGRSADDRQRDSLDHPAEVLRLAGIKPGMQVADYLAADGYYSELLGYLVGPKGHVLSTTPRTTTGSRTPGRSASPTAGCRRYGLQPW